MKYILFYFLLTAQLLSEQVKDTSALIELKDTSGLSEEAVRLKAEESDLNKGNKNISLKEVYENTDSNGSVNLADIQASWEELTPKTNGFDWVKTKDGEWFKGEIKAMYDSSLEFDSKEMDIYTFDFHDIAYIKSNVALSVNIEKVASITGIIRMDEKKIKIIQGDKEYEFDRSQIVSFAPSGALERNYWSGKITFSLDTSRGNTNQLDYSSKLNLKRRTDSSRLSFDYLGRVSLNDGVENTRNHRITETFDIYISRRFFWTPLYLEYYTDNYQNIDRQITASLGIGYMLIDEKRLEWHLSGGPGTIYTKYTEVEDGRSLDVKAPSLELRTKLEWDMNKKNDLIYDYKLTLSDSDSGSYKHHMILSLENELTSWLDIDISMIWDHIAKPAKTQDGVALKKNDYQLLLGLGVEF